ncbi:MAG: nickel pincer cofactor biosynthesis protein LarC [Terrimicrobiaceae bacterium]
MRILYFDCFSGIAGDMCVGALRDLGVPEEVFLDAIAALHLPDHFHCHFHRSSRQGISGWKFDVHTHEHEHPHEHPHEHSHSHGRTASQIFQLLDAARLKDEVKNRARAVFQRIAVAEGRIHGLPPEVVAFHEVGAVDSIADIVAACAGIDFLHPDCIAVSNLVEGTGFIRCAHGNFPLPAPATLAILEGIPLRQVDDPHEWITPTGAALVAEFGESFGPMPALKVGAIGYGLGTRDTTARPNALRAVLGEIDAPSNDLVAVLETQTDDCSPEILASATACLLEEGALDVFTTAVTMKKGRSGHLITVIAKPGDTNRLCDLLIRQTTTFGVRIREEHRSILDREVISVETPYGPVAVKLGKRSGRLIHAQPEFDSCREAAELHGCPVREVYAAAASKAIPHLQKREH